MQRRAGGLIIQNKKLLLVTDGSGYYWTPGGRLENEENYEQALRRELDEELGAKIKTATVYKNPIKDDAETHYFLVEVDGELKPNNEVSAILWYSKEDFQNNTYRVTPRITKHIYPFLIEDNLV